MKQLMEMTTAITIKHSDRRLNPEIFLRFPDIFSENKHTTTEGKKTIMTIKDTTMHKPQSPNSDAKEKGHHMK